jgi:hypothetical protein
MPTHRQWGNVVVLHTVFQNPLLQHLIDPNELRETTVKVYQFLSEVVQPSSALAEDIKILDNAARRSKLWHFR